MSRNAKRKRTSIGQSIGGVVAGFDYQVFRTTPPPHELVQKAAPIRGVSGEGGTEVEVTFPEDAVEVAPESDRSDGRAPETALEGRETG